MIYLDNNNKILTLFNSKEFCELNNVFNCLAPSMCEYHFRELIRELSNNVILNKTNIQDKIDIYDYTLYLDYNNDIYLEYISNNEYETESLW